MTTIINLLDHGIILEGTSDCGRVVARSDRDDAYLDGRLVVRGYHTDNNGSVDMSAPVNSDDWSLVVATMHDVDDAYDRAVQESDKARADRLDAKEAWFAGIERVRGGAYDPNADGWN